MIFDSGFRMNVLNWWFLDDRIIEEYAIRDWALFGWFCAYKVERVFCRIFGNTLIICGHICIFALDSLGCAIWPILPLINIEDNVEFRFGGIFAQHHFTHFAWFYNLSLIFANFCDNTILSILWLLRLWFSWVVRNCTSLLLFGLD